MALVQAMLSSIRTTKEAWPASMPAAIRMSRSSPGETFRYSRRVPVALETASATSSMVNGGPPSSYTAFRWLSWVSAVTQAAA